MSEKQRISLLKSSHERLKKSTIALLAGEICLVDTKGTGYDSLVIGDGETQAKDLPLLGLGMEGMTYLGEARPTTIPGAMGGNAFYFAKVSGSYNGFGEIVLREGEVAFLVYEYGGWRKDILSLVDQEVKENSLNPVSGKAVAEALKSKVSGIKIGGRTITGEIVEIPVDDVLDPNSENPIMNKVVTNKFSEIDDWFNGD